MSFKLFVKNKIKFHDEWQLFHVRASRQPFFQDHLTSIYCVGTPGPFLLYPVLLCAITFVYFLSSHFPSLFSLTLKPSVLIWKGPSSVKRIRDLNKTNGYPPSQKSGNFCILLQFIEMCSQRDSHYFRVPQRSVSFFSNEGKTGKKNLHQQYTT